MTNEEKAQEIVNKQLKWRTEFVERNNLSKLDANQLESKIYNACLEMAKWKDEQFQEYLFE